MMKKTTYQWKEEAENFVYEYEQATGHKPSLNEVVAECKDIGIDNYKEYAEKLFSYMEEA